MRRLLLPALLAGSLLAGCSTGPNGQPLINGQPINLGGITQADVTNAAIKVCSFVPAATTVANLISAALASGIPALQTAEGIAAAICQAVTANPPTTAQARRRLVTPPTVLGVPVKGQFLR